VKVNHLEQVAAAPVTMEGASGCRVRWLIDEQDGAPNFAMRQFEIEPGGFTPRHSHPYEHEVFVLEGDGLVYEGDVAHPLRAGDVIYVAPNDVHQFQNTGELVMKFLCLVPNSHRGQPVTMAAECARPQP
jgi:quercetin dioxygenase-like cupin family protein